MSSALGYHHHHHLQQEQQQQQQKPFSDSDSYSDSDSDTTNSQNQHSADLTNSIFKSYFEHANHQSLQPTQHDLTKIKSFLTSSSSGALSCLICLERIKTSDPTWSCTSLCYAVFHLICIQSWARQASDLSALRASLSPLIKPLNPPPGIALNAALIILDLKSPEITSVSVAKSKIHQMILGFYPILAVKSVTVS
jgi:hypothetical protein